MQPPLSRVATNQFEHALATLNAAVVHGDRAAISTVLWKVPDDQARQLIAAAHKACFRDVLNNNHFTFVQCVLERFPEKTRFFTLFEEAAGSASPHRTILSPDGVEEVVKYLAGKGKLWPHIKTAVCEDYSTFKAHLGQMLREPHAGQSGYYLVRHSDPSVPEKYRVHFTAVFVSKLENGQGVAAFISDCNSTAHTERKNVKDPGKDFAFRIGQLAKDVCPQAVLFTSLEGRQADRSNCPVFALHDTVHMQKVGDMVAYAAGQKHHPIRHPDYAEVALLGIEALPLGMVKVTQSLTKARAFLTELPSDVQKRKLDTSLNKHTAWVGPRAINVSIANKYLEYERYILLNAIF